MFAKVEMSPWNIPPPCFDALTSAEEERLRDLVRQWMSEQGIENPVNYRLLYGRDVDKRGIPELAAQEGLTENAVSSRLSRMRQRLRTWLAEHGAGPENAE
jgi:DNA-directed RNA polymerase specialized sigma24 family protein